MNSVLSKNSDIFLALFVVAIATMLLVPLPVLALDVLLAINISGSFLLLLVGLYIPNALALLSFPALLLLSTLLRLSLNVASTRLILSQGEAGDIIDAFGNFLIRGEIVVGVIIFIIITIVNFVVIARGSSRVSAVAARFALESLPGKQMAIEADMRSGIISSQEARKKREDLKKESQLYGAMDGAMMFVQGDAIAGFFIIFTNIIGGIYIGIKNGMSFSNALETYSMLTVGDGLVTQVPALLISICAGIIVTRVSSGENSTLGRDLGSQLFSRPSLLYLTAIIALFIGLLNGIPFLPFFLVFLALLIFGYSKQRQNTNKSLLSNRPVSIRVTEALTLESGNQRMLESNLNSEEVIRLVLDSKYLYQFYLQDKISFENWWQNFCDDCFTSSGIPMRALNVSSSDKLSPGSFEAFHDNTRIDSGNVALNSFLAMVHPDVVDIFGLELVAEVSDPKSGIIVSWVKNNLSSQNILNSGQIDSLSPVQYVATRASYSLIKNPEKAISITYIHSLVKQIESQYPGLMTDALDTNFLNVSRLTEVFRELSRQNISISDFKGVLEALASYCSMDGAEKVRNEIFDLQDVVAYIRLKFTKEIILPTLSGSNVVKAIIVDTEVSDIFQAVNYKGAHKSLGIRPDLANKLKVSLDSIAEPIKRFGTGSFTVLCSAEIFYQVKKFLQDSDIFAHVVKYEEVSPGIRLEPVGIWKI